MKKIIFATKNRGKLREVKKIFEGSSFEIMSLLDFPEVPEIVEDALTFRDNALIKARTVFKHFNIPAIGDDSGLEVEQLDREPGVMSARYAGETADDLENNKKLLVELGNQPEPHRARFVCAAVFMDETKIIDSFGEVKGRIVKNGRGTNGFGYDPLFVPDGYSQTMGELDLDEKNKISHRSIAFKRLRSILEQLLE